MVRLWNGQYVPNTAWFVKNDKLIATNLSGKAWKNTKLATHLQINVLATRDVVVRLFVKNGKTFRISLFGLLLPLSEDVAKL